MAHVANPRKQFQFTILIAGMNPFLCQKLSLPDTEVDVVEHGDSNYKVKTGGMKTYGTLKMDKLSSANAPDNYFWEWIMSVQNEFLGGGVLPQIYKREITVMQLGTDGQTIINEWTWEGAWPFKINGIELSRLSSENTIESIEFQIDRQGHI